MTESEDKILAALKKKYENMPEEVRDYWNKKIDSEFKRRKKKNSIADDPKDYAKGRQIGQQDPGDISYKEPWQHVVREQTGLTIPYGTHYTCPVCGYKYLLDFPPPRCVRCGTKSFLHLKNVVNLKV